MSLVEIRCPIYGFVTLNEWEAEIVAQPEFQRLRRIRQLGWTDAVYPGAMHTRFEHSLGVMHMATQLFDGIVSRNQELLKSELAYTTDGLHRHRQLVRLAALLHDIGHGPFSHAAEELFQTASGTPAARRHQHEEYSLAIIRSSFRDLIENHPANRNCGFTADDVAGLIEGKAKAGPASLWQDLISGQIDADRMDYLLRDSWHAGVEYGKYDWRRVVICVELVPDPETGSLRFGISDGGRHVAEALIIARYMMFSQVYFHKTRVILDHHLEQAMRSLITEGQFPPPVPERLHAYLDWDDWRVLGRFAAGEGGDHARRLRERRPFKLVWETSEFPDESEMEQLAAAEAALAPLLPVRRAAANSWYRLAPAEDPLVKASNPGGTTRPLSQESAIVRNMHPSRRVRLYVRPEDRQAASNRLQGL
ncbi:MAG: HD domain-containing protein [Rhodospirillales bacterium]|nr:HD domain-containing protein [Rhodospirillales bacterium]